MKLHEIKRRDTKFTKTVTVEPADGIYGKFKVEVDFEYEAPSTSQHDDDDASTRERHAATIDITSIKLAQNVTQHDEDGEKVGEHKKGSDATKLKGWTKQDEKHIEDELDEKMAGYPR